MKKLHNSIADRYLWNISHDQDHFNKSKGESNKNIIKIRDDHLAVLTVYLKEKMTAVDARDLFCRTSYQNVTREVVRLMLYNTYALIEN